MTPFHPAYGLTDETRAKILKDAEILGVARAAEVNNVSGTAIYKWRKRIVALPPAPPTNDLWR